MISSTPVVAGAGSKVLGAQLLICSSVMAVEVSNWLAVGVDGKTNISSSSDYSLQFLDTLFSCTLIN